MEHSLTASRTRPDLMVMFNNALLFKGEETASYEDMSDAKEDLICKMSIWSQWYHGTVRAAPPDVRARTTLGFGLCGTAGPPVHHDS